MPEKRKQAGRQINIRIDNHVERELWNMAKEGGHPTVAALVKSIVLAVVRDDAIAHGRKPVDG